MIAITDGERELAQSMKDRLFAAREYVHEHTCPQGDRAPSPCVACPPLAGVLRGLVALDAKASDVASVRDALHDVACMSECGPGSEHAKTQAKPAAALRKFVASELVEVS